MAFKRFPEKKDAIAQLSDLNPPFKLDEITFKVTSSGCAIKLPLHKGEEIYGFGLQLKGFRQTGHKKHIRPNADPLSNSGDSHAPAPYYVSTGGYAVLVDTARYASFYCGQAKEKGFSALAKAEYTAHTDTDSLYTADTSGNPGKMLVEIPIAKGADIYMFTGESMLEAVQKYNLFSGGGVSFPAWSLGIWYRLFGKSTDKEWLDMAKKFRRQKLPVSVLGLEPGWQSAAYSCSYVWDKERAANYRDFMREVSEMGYKVNLWEHAYVHPTSPIYSDLIEYSGDYEVWKGLVPDFTIPEARKIFADYHRENITSVGVSGFKLDECDGSDYTNHWAFPNSAEFPSGLDGEQMHSLFGILYQQTVLEISDKPSMHSVRNSHALAAPYPFVLYSDLYEHRDFIRGVANMGFSGLLWSPEVRHATSVKDLIRRIQTVILSPQALINAWYIKNPPWEQINRQKNNDGEIMEDSAAVTAMVKELFEFREKLIPYLVEAFNKYKRTGIPPFRALVLDYPDDYETYEIDNQYMIGDCFMAAPLTSESDIRHFYIPKGKWTLYGTNEVYENGWFEREFSLKELALFSKA